jgi:Niemann-Pick C1 protein
MDQSLMLAIGIIKRCPSCLQNFVRHFCDMTCASNQSEFLVVKKTDVDTKSKSYYPIDIAEEDIYVRIFCSKCNIHH